MKESEIKSNQESKYTATELEERCLTPAHLAEYQAHLQREEKSTATVTKYLRDARAFFHFLSKGSVTKEICIEYKNHLMANQYKVRSVKRAEDRAMDGHWRKCCNRTRRVALVVSLRMRHREICCGTKSHLSSIEKLRLFT